MVKENEIFDQVRSIKVVLCVIEGILDSVEQKLTPVLTDIYKGDGEDTKRQGASSPLGNSLLDVNLRLDKIEKQIITLAHRIVL